MKYEEDRVIDLQKIKHIRQRRKRLAFWIFGIGLALLLLLVGWVVVTQILEVVGPGDFWGNFTS